MILEKGRQYTFELSDGSFIEITGNGEVVHSDDSYLRLVEKSL